MKKTLLVILMTVLLVLMAFFAVSCGKGNDSDITDTSTSDGTNNGGTNNGGTNNGGTNGGTTSHTHTEAVLEGKSATCVEAGLTEGKYCTECGETLVAQVEIPKTESHERKQKIAMLGECGSAYSANVCQICGDVEITHLEIDCNIETVVDGNTVTTICEYCGLEISLVPKGDYACGAEAKLVATYKEEVVLKSDSYKVEGHAKIEFDVIDLSDKFECGVELVVEKCSICDKVVEIKSATHKGDLAQETNGDTTIYKCEACPFKRVESTEALDDCTETTIKVVQIYNKDALLYEGKSISSSGKHTLEKEYISGDGSCDDGYLTKNYCTACDYTFYEVGFGCIEGESGVISLEGISSCGGEYSVSKCMVCQNIVNNSYFATECNPTYEDKTETDENGKEIDIQIATCQDCGLVYETGFSDITEFSCIRKYCYSYKMYIGETVLYEYESIYISEDQWHDEETSYELLGDSCLDGVKTTVTCRYGCGYESSYIYNSHTAFNTNRIQIDGVCVGRYFCEEACLCGYMKDYYLIYCDNAEQDYEYYEKDGIEYGKVTTTCPDCNLLFVEENWCEENPELCQSVEKGRMSLSVGETVIYDNIIYVTDIYSYHSYEREIILYGDDCEDGYLEIKTCKICDKIEYDENYYHNTYEVESKVIPSTCGDITITRRECPCGERGDIDYDYSCDTSWEETKATDENGFVNVYYNRECANCALVIKEDHIYTKGEGCTKERNVYITIVCTNIEGEEITFEYSYLLDIYEYHNYIYTYEVLGNNCDNGVVEVITCADCDYYLVDEYSGHAPNQNTYVDILFGNYGGCGGCYRYGECPCKEQIVNFYLNTYSCDMDSTETTEERDGVLYTTTTDTCNSCGLTIISVSYQEAEGCYTYEYIERTIKMGERVILDKQEEKHIAEENHNNTYTYELAGEDCYDGWCKTGTCQDCGNVSYGWYSSHDYVIEFLQSDLKGEICDIHYFSIRHCVCKEYYIFDVSANSELDENDGVYSCADCGLVITDSFTLTENEDCTATGLQSYVVSVNGEVQYSYEKAEIYEKHSFEVSGAKVVNGNMVALTACKKCDLAFSNEICTTNGFIDGDWANEYQFTFTPQEAGKYSFYLLDNGGKFMVRYDEEGYTTDVSDNVLQIEAEAGATYKVSMGRYSGVEDFQYAFVEGEIPETDESVDEIVQFTVTVGNTTYEGQINKSNGKICSVAVQE